MRKIGAIAVVVAAAVAVALPAPGLGKPNPPLKCKDYGTLQTETGATFASERDCKDYTKAGGVLFAPSVVIDPSPAVGTSWNIYATGFHPNSTTTLYYLPPDYIENPNHIATYPFPLPTDANGDLEPINASVSGCGFTVGYRVRDAYGVTAMGFVDVVCP